ECGWLGRVKAVLRPAPLGWPGCADYGRWAEVRCRGAIMQRASDLQIMRCQSSDGASVSKALRFGQICSYNGHIHDSLLHVFKASVKRASLMLSQCFVEAPVHNSPEHT